MKVRVPLALTIGFCLTILVLLTTANGVAGQDNKPAKPPEDLVPQLEPILTIHKVPGLAAVVLQGETIIRQGAVGVRQRGSDEKLTIDDLFHIGSCTKAMTATLCARLIEQRKLSWDSTIAKIFPDLGDKIHPEYRDVTLEQLLTHRAAIPPDPDDAIWEKIDVRKGTISDRRAIIFRELVARKPEHKPGTKFQYSNLGYIIVGLMVEQVTKKSWETLMQEELFTPLGMKSAGFGPPGMAQKVDQPRGHNEAGKPVAPGELVGDNPPVYGPAGRVHCTLADWSKFIALHLRGEKAKAKFLGADSFKKLHTPPRDNEDYAGGWGVVERDWGGGTVLTHGGSNTLWFAVTWVAPRRDFAILVVCNQGGKVAQSAVSEAVVKLLEPYLQKKE